METSVRRVSERLLRLETACLAHVDTSYQGSSDFSGESLVTGVTQK
jgi:hypothetical protein